MKRFYCFLAILICLSAVLPAYGEYVRVESFPTAVTRPYGNISVQFLPDGRLVAWDGDTVYVQALPGGEMLRPVARGYMGDTAFLAVSPDGHTLVLGAGLSSKLYKLDLNHPVDYTPGSELGVYGHYWGVFLNEQFLLVDRMADDWSTDELVILDLLNPTLAPISVMDKPRASDVPLNGFAASAGLAVDRERGYVYTMGLLYDSSFMVVESSLKRIPLSTMINAYFADSKLQWASFPAITPGPSVTGGPVAVMGNGDVLTVGFGGVERLNPETGVVVGTYAPGGFVYHGAAYDARTNQVYVLATDTAEYTMDLFYAPAGSFEKLPAAGVFGLICMAAMTAAAGCRRVRR